MKVFIAGIMQGSLPAEGMHDQDYRKRLCGVLKDYDPNIEIIDPIRLHPDSLAYGEEQASQVLFDMAELAAASDIVIAYLPTASMGTAQEMVRAYDRDRAIISITPLQKNWFVNAYSTLRFDDVDAFSHWLNKSRLEDLS